MKSTSQNSEEKQQGKRGISDVLKYVFGGEFLLGKQMRPWYFYVAVLLLLTMLTIVSEQSILEKKQTITKLENEYKSELSRLKANNQFIPYEENQILIRKMQEKGYVLDEEHNYTIRVKREVPEKRRLFSKKRKNGK